ncbi:hypothetical protein CP973_10340 [Streptomyces albofaciens JCM 4342]|uniref:hypothetical protein n=1 Tax=Streptomyces albofaciens TaxID=66866 RepID=UPI0012397200|nr:hypothetical protein [Streptomyces albofaciens]KAA6222293.1 hypothetical protein CP973_10340 [Streptomyces albofaciens JCM 4342]
MANADFQPRTFIRRNQAWTSGNGETLLRLQEDGNFVAYRDGKASWQADGVYPNGDTAAFEMDGDLVVYDSSGRQIWHSDTGGNHGAKLSVQDDGNIVIYNASDKPIWATNTA